MRRIALIFVLHVLAGSLGCASRSEGLLSQLGGGIKQLGRNVVNEGPNSDYRYGGPHKPPSEAEVAAGQSRESPAAGRSTAW